MHYAVFLAAMIKYLTETAYRRKDLLCLMVLEFQPTRAGKPWGRSSQWPSVWGGFSAMVTQKGDCKLELGGVAFKAPPPSDLLLPVRPTFYRLPRLGTRAQEISD